MLKQLKNVIDNMTWYLRSGVSPINNKAFTNIEELKNMNHMASRKFAMTMVAVSIIAFMYFASVMLLFLLPNDPQVSALVSMYKDMIVAIASIVATLVGIQGLVDWKYNSDSKTVISSNHIKEEKYIEEYLSGPKEDDYTLDIELISKNKKI
jgi:hypothetical protein